MSALPSSSPDRAELFSPMSLTHARNDHRTPAFDLLLVEFMRQQVTTFTEWRSRFRFPVGGGGHTDTTSNFCIGSPKQAEPNPHSFHHHSNSPLNAKLQQSGWGSRRYWLLQSLLIRFVKNQSLCPWVSREGQLHSWVARSSRFFLNSIVFLCEFFKLRRTMWKLTISNDDRPFSCIHSMKCIEQNITKVNSEP